MGGADQQDGPRGFVKGDAVTEEALLEMFRAIIANNRAGGWRKIKDASGPF